MAKNLYYTLLTSLPHINSLFDNRITPLSRYQLERRLSMLPPVQRALLGRIESLLFWEYLDEDTGEPALIRLANKTVEEITSRSLRGFVNRGLDRRTLVAALRRRKRGEQAPAAPGWSYGTRHEYIRRHWSSPVFGLGSAFPVVHKIATAMEADDPLSAEKAVLQCMWESLDDLASSHLFDFESVVVYVMRWNLVQRWVSYDNKKAARRFDQLVDEALGDFAGALPDAGGAPEQRQN